MRIALCFLLLAASCSLISAEAVHNKDRLYLNAFKGWLKAHNKVYKDNAEFQKRFATFKDNHQHINRHNKEAEQGIHTHTLGLNHLADLSLSEFQARLSHISTGSANEASTDSSLIQTSSSVPTSIDWRALGAVGPVRNQGSCSSGWAFAVADAAAAAWKLTGRPLLDLSEQQLIDCVSGGSYTCSTGGNPQVAFQDIISRGGIQAESTYPYCTCSGRGCRFNRAAAAATLRSFSSASGASASENGLLNMVATRPVVAAIDASSRDFQLYRSGVFTGACGTSLNQVVSVVGYTQNAWIVRNSWGSGWGNGGYILLQRGAKKCGIGSYYTWAYA